MLVVDHEIHPRNGRSALRSLLCALALCLAAIGCGDDDTNNAEDDDDGHAHAHDTDAGDHEAADGGGGKDTAPLYAMMTQVYGTDDDRTVYLSLSHTLDLDGVDLKEAREFPGVANFETVGGRILVSSGQGPEIYEFDITEDLKWIERRTVNFSGYPLPDGDFANFYAQYIVNDHAAYLPFEVKKRIIWDPTEMEILGTRDDSDLPETRDGLQLDTGGNRNSVRFEGPVLQPFYFHDEDWLHHGDTSLVAVYDPKTHEESQIIELPCPGLSMTTQDEDGNTYFGTWSYAGTLALFGEGAAPCMARVKPDLTVDEDWTTDWTDVTDGRYVNNFRYVGKGKAIGNVLYPELVEGADFSHGYDPDLDEALWADGNWRFWMFDVEEHTGKPVEGVDEAVGSGAQFAVLDGRTFVFLPFDEWSKTAVYELDADGVAEKRFVVAGDVFKWVRVR
jgi:hypothetical protein